MSEDTGTLAEVPEQMQLDVDDDGEGSTAGEEGDGTEDLDAIYDEPGDVVPEKELS